MADQSPLFIVFQYWKPQVVARNGLREKGCPPKPILAKSGHPFCGREGWFSNIVLVSNRVRFATATRFADEDAVAKQ